ncbi:guanosine-3'%2C5'-bis(diphosphate) 3'-pyrophosphohydrolase [Bordetella pertussis]|nr:guanosine-3'%2C5'-bis(diphosphate) 3'-pyrophosphohydrolase [Bordetella pertussis]CFP13206.1 guanosine-3'%2C5'-bis(diphosphate) 3'-pyrophosphohydrolase [Bordetella pertussis]CFT92679.1 guanosine-3'%2C5'-bis(diphosphate) 3'-pyrophosphohydrolase [Bordetella pertussis]CRE14225.1 guanosine-3'%2C5'-bis(diphosphate) 3'-pyrophosphohydrolase [Bordetella pertussis]
MRLGHGLVVHTSDCPVALRARAREPERWINVAWDAQTAKHLPTRLDIVTRNERGVLGRLAAEVTAADANIVHVTMHDDAVSTVSLHLTVQVDSRKHLAQVIRAIRHVPQVQKIVRVKG